MYIAHYSVERIGWCIYDQKDDSIMSTFHSGPFTEAKAKKQAQHLNDLAATSTIVMATGNGLEPGNSVLISNGRSSYRATIAEITSSTAIKVKRRATWWDWLRRIWRAIFFWRA